MEITAETAFELSDESSTTANVDVLGMWRVGVPKPSVAFAASRSTTPEVPLWRIDLPADPIQAARRLEAGHVKLRAASNRLAEATARLDAALDHSRPGVTFTTETPIPGTSAETELAGWQRLTSGCRPSAWIETRIQGEPVARSLLGLEGNVRTVCRPGLGPRGAGLHRDGVGLVVASRAAFLRVVGCVTRGAAAPAPTSMRATCAWSVPGGPPNHVAASSPGRPTRAARYGKYTLPAASRRRCWVRTTARSTSAARLSPRAMSVSASRIRYVVSGSRRATLRRRLAAASRSPAATSTRASPASAGAYRGSRARAVR